MTGMRYHTILTNQNEYKIKDIILPADKELILIKQNLIKPKGTPRKS